MKKYYFLLLVGVLLILSIGCSNQKSICGDYYCDANESCKDCSLDCGLCESVTIFNFTCKEVETDRKCSSLCEWGVVTGIDEVGYKIQISLRDIKENKIISRGMYESNKTLLNGKNIYESLSIEHSCSFGKDGFDYLEKHYMMDIIHLK